MSHQQKTIYSIAGMTCTSCEVIIERTLQKIPGVTSVSVNHAKGTCEIRSEKGQRVSKKAVREALRATEYEIADAAQSVSSSWNWKHPLRILLVVGGVYLVSRALGVFSLDASVDQGMSLGSVFVVGLIASVSSCMAVVGGLVLTFTTTLKRTNAAVTRWQLWRSHMFFHGGRLLGYFFLGGLVAVVGAAIAPSPRLLGGIGLLAALVMILLAFDLLGLSGSSRWIPRMPKRISHWIHDLAERSEWWIPFLLGVLTFFLPCGFTQSMQLFALTAGGFLEGGLALLVFALGTLPALLLIGLLASSFSTKSRVYRWFLLVAGAVVLLLGVYNVGNSLSLLGVEPSQWFERSSSSLSASEGVAATRVGDVQVVQMSVDGILYLPDTFTLQKDVPVEWQIDGSGATGCTSIIAIPLLGLSAPLKTSGLTTLSFTPTKAGRLPFTCGMGMASGLFLVVE